jgi:hypothetical protein
MAWAGLQLYGESSLVVGAPRSDRFPLLPVTVAALLLSLAAALLLRVRR